MGKGKSEHRGARSYAREARLAPSTTPPVALLPAHYRLAFWALRTKGNFQLRAYDCRSWEDAWVEVRDWEHLEALINDTHFDFLWNPEPKQEWHPLARNLFRTAIKARRLEPAVVVSNIIQRDGLTAEAMEKAWWEGLRLGAALGDLRHKVTDKVGHPSTDELGGRPPWLPDGTEHLPEPLDGLAGRGLKSGPMGIKARGANQKEATLAFDRELHPGGGDVTDRAAAVYRHIHRLASSAEGRGHLESLGWRFEANGRLRRGSIGYEHDRHIAMLLRSAKTSH